MLDKSQKKIGFKSGFDSSIIRLWAWDFYRLTVDAAQVKVYMT